MAVYVDDAIHPWRGKKWCHMFADDLRELHRLAAAIGLKRAWFQNDPRLPHYDLTESKRKLALSLGAKEVSYSVTAQYIKKRISRQKKLGSKLSNR